MTNPAGGAVSEEVKLTVVEPVAILNEPEGELSCLAKR